MKELIKKIEIWGYDRNLQTANSLIQTTKTLEEVIELQQAILNDNILEIKDAIGDIFVTLVMLKIQNINFNLEYNKNEFGVWVDPFKKTAILLRDIAEIQHNIIVFRNPNDIQIETTERIIWNLRNISDYYNLTLKECVEHAYNEIKDRKGKMINGLWMKEN